jgi:hypothetical protein
MKMITNFYRDVKVGDYVYYKINTVVYKVTAISDVHRYKDTSSIIKSYQADVMCHGTSSRYDGDSLLEFDVDVNEEDDLDDPLYLVTEEEAVLLSI